MSAGPSKIIPGTVHNLLNSVRSPIFLTNYNPTNARLGNKYIRRALVGPAMNKYYSKPDHRLKKLNDPGPRGVYPGWNETPSIIGTRKAISTSHKPDRSDQNQSDNAEKEGSEDGEVVQEAKSPVGESASDKGPGEQGKSVATDGVSGSAEPKPVWLVDEYQRYRNWKLDSRRRIGKVRPKKGKWSKTFARDPELIHV